MVRGTVSRRLAWLLMLLAPLVVRAQPRSPVIQDRVALDPREPVNFHVLVTPDTVYVGQQATYELGVFIAEGAQQRMRRNPEVVPAELRGVVAYDLGGPQSLPPITRQGLRAYPHVLQRAVFPLTAGRVVIPASRLSYALPRNASFFSREEMAVLLGDEVSLVVRPLPAADRPTDFSGAVGEISVRATLDASSARVGEPVLLTVRVSGRGNVKLWPRPTLQADGATLVESSERVRVDSTGQFIRGDKEFDWLVTPSREGELVLPAVRYAYFDPWAARYDAVATDSVRLIVTAGEFVPPADVEDAVRTLPLRRADRGALPRPWSQQPVVWALVALAPCALLWRRRRVAPRDASALARADWRDSGAYVASGARDAIPDDVRSASAAVIGARSASPAALPEATRAARERRRHWLDALALALEANAEIVGSVGTLERQLRRRGVTRETTARVVRMSSELDTLAWGAPDRSAASRDTHTRDAHSLDARVVELLGAVRAEALPSARTPTAGGARRGGRMAPRLLLLVLTLAGTVAVAARVGAQAPATGGSIRLQSTSAAPATSNFADAVAVFDAGQFSRAAEQFRAMAEQSPTRVDAWVNAGSAAWAAGDTVQAVRAWHRALRLEPSAADVRARLQRLGAGQVEGIAAVPDISRNLLVAVALLIWVGAWVYAAIMPAPRARLVWLIAGGAACCAVVLGAVVWQLERGDRTDRLAIVRAPLPLRVAPGTDANALGSVATGDVVRREASRVDATAAATWIAITHADGRTGWIPDDALVNIR
jgi:hypothetical protein